MLGPTRAISFVLLLVALGLTSPAAAQPSSTPAAGLRIVVVEGEDAVNIVQQKTAVAPVVEVRDQNDQPVAGVIVRFAIRNGRATFSGARTLSITTNAAGRAVATGLTPTGSGALQIGASAAFQGQTAAATIVQTNVMTVAEAATVSGGGASGGASATAGGAAGGGTGGGLSATTIGVIGGAAAGSVVAVKELVHGTIYSGPLTGTLPMAFPGGCTRLETHNGSLEIELNEEVGEVRGTWKAEANFTITPGTCNPNDSSNNKTENINHGKGAVSGTPERITFSGVNAGDNPPPSVNTYTFSFVGTLSEGEITGQFTLGREVGYPAGDPRNGRGSVTQNVTLRQQ